ncbi:MAG: hypothetical protein D6767_04405 [Candidatus Hydrogenedentota bacterium]|nr:MAG: hypothetical protein D6767_04405 [Candidatus Hydrogenedentota bacterium]
MQQKKLVCLNGILLIFSISCGSASKKTQKNDYVRAIGVAPIYNNEMGRAKDDALLDAKRNAVRKALGDILSAKSESVDGVLVESKITAKTQGFIEDYKIVSAAPVSKHEYRVTIDAKVNRAILERTVDEVLSTLERPRIMVLCRSQSKANEVVLWEESCVQSMEKGFQEKGFELVDRSQTEKLLKKEKKAIQKAMAGRYAKLANAAVDTGAEVILLASFSISNAGFVLSSKLQSMQATIEIRGIETGTARILATESAKAAYPHIDPKVGGKVAIQKAIQKAIPSLIEQVMQKWDPNRAQTISMLVVGLDYASMKAFRNELLEKIRGVKEVNRKGATGQAAKLEIQFVGTSFELADRLLDANLPFQIKVTKVQPNLVHIAAKRK